MHILLVAAVCSITVQYICCLQTYTAIQAVSDFIDISVIMPFAALILLF